MPRKRKNPKEEKAAKNPRPSIPRKAKSKNQYEPSTSQELWTDQILSLPSTSYIQASLASKSQPLLPTSSLSASSSDENSLSSENHAIFLPNETKPVKLPPKLRVKSKHSNIMKSFLPSPTQINEQCEESVNKGNCNIFLDSPIINSSDTLTGEETETPRYCFCNSPYDNMSEMIGCDSSQCPIEWYHFKCVGIVVPPEGDWFCPGCIAQQSKST